MLPKSYQEVEWLESTGTQYIDTGITPSGDMRVKFDLVRLSSTIRQHSIGGAKQGNVWGLYVYVSNAYNSQTNVDAGAVACAYGSDNRYLTGGNAIVINKRCFLEIDISNIDGLKTYLDQELQSTLPFSNPSITLSWYLFANNLDGKFDSSRVSYIRLYSFEMEKDSTQVSHLVPCYRISDNKPGMYDTVRGVFLTNQGSGEFVTGPPVYPSMYRQTHPYEMGRRRKALISATNNALPSEYKRVEYLESTGTQWINTGINPNNNLTVRCIFSLDQRAMSHERNYVFGCFYSNVSRLQYSYSSTVFAAWGDRYITAKTDNINTDRHVITASKSGFTLDDVVVYSPTSDNFSGLAIIYLFAMYASGTTSFLSDGVKIHSASIADNSTQVLNLIPCYRISDNKSGMYDTVSKQFLTNRGTGEFIIGPEV